MTRPRLVILAAAVALTATGCGERSEPTGSSVVLYPVTIANAGERPFVARSAARRIAVLAEGPVVTLARLGAGKRVVGVPAGTRRGFTPRARLVVDPRGRILLRELRAVRPDLIVASSAFPRDELDRAAEVTGASLYVAPEASVRDVERAISDLGLLVGEPIAARRLVGRIEASRQAVEDRLASARPVDVFVDTGFFTTVSDRSLVGDLIRLARGKNVAGPTPEPGPFDLRELARLDPQVYLATSDSDTSLRALRRNDRTRRLRAVRTGRFRLVPATVLQPGPRVGTGLQAIARALHPDAFR